MTATSCKTDTACIPPRCRKRKPEKLLCALNLYGLDHLDALILAALADERPLLLLGPHGTAKSELLNRIATALELDHRHYNASLISFDDLLGYPVPNSERNGLDYLRTPDNLWQAESVFLDEISRCRAEHQNKLFSIIHERRVQGLALENLRYRWAAMNPPTPLDGSDLDDDEPIYQGSLPLDPALADRFAWVVIVPALAEIDPAARRALLASGGEDPGTSSALQALVGQTKTLLANADIALREWAISYVDAAIAPLRDAHIAISGRRAIMLVNGILSLDAASQVLGLSWQPDEVAELVLRWGLPQAASGRPTPPQKLRAVHRLTLKLIDEPADGTWRRLREEADPVRRVAIALADPSLSRTEVSTLVTDAFAAQDKAQRYLLARTLVPILSSRDCVTVTTLETLGKPLGELLSFSMEKVHKKSCTRQRAGEWDRLLGTVSRLQKEHHPEAEALGNLLYALFAMDIKVRNPDGLIAQNDRWRDLFAPLLQAPLIAQVAA